MKAQIKDDTIVAFGIALKGDDVFEPIPDDYSFEKYDYTPIESGVFNPNGFTIKLDYIEPENYIL